MRSPAVLTIPPLFLVLFMLLNSCGEPISPKGSEQVANPTFGFVSGPSGGITLATSTPGATIRYTMNGTTPSATQGLVYSSPIQLTASTTIKAIAFRSGWKSSQVTSQTFTLPPPADQVATPVASPEPGTFTTAQLVTLSTSTEGAKIYYTINEEFPTSTSGTLYESPFSISSDTVLRAIAVKTGWDESDDFWGQYLIAPSATGSITVTVQ